MRIAVIGPQNTGKSTFIKDFLKEFPHYITPVKTLSGAVEEKKLKINQMTNLETQKEIRDFMLRQMRDNKEENIIFDRCLIDNFAYSYHKFEEGNIPEIFIKESEKLMKQTIDDIEMYIFIPTAVSVPLVGKGTRDTDPSYIDKMNNIFLKVLFDLAKTHQINIKVISGTPKDRIKEIKKFI